MFPSRSITSTLGAPKPKVVSNRSSIEFDGVDGFLDSSLAYNFYNNGDTKPYTVAAWVKLPNSPSAGHDGNGSFFSDDNFQCTWSYVYRHSPGGGDPDIRITHSAGGINESGLGQGNEYLMNYDTNWHHIVWTGEQPLWGVNNEGVTPGTPVKYFVKNKLYVDGKLVKLTATDGETGHQAGINNGGTTSYTRACSYNNADATITIDDETDVTWIRVGQMVTGTGIPANSYVASITQNSEDPKEVTEFELNVNTNGDGSGGNVSGGTLTFKNYDSVTETWSNSAGIIEFDIKSEPQLYRCTPTPRSDYMQRLAISQSTPSYYITSYTRIGSNRGSTYFPGYIDEVAFWDSTLSKSEISYIYKAGRYKYTKNSGKYKSSANLKGWWRMGDASNDLITAGTNATTAMLIQNMAESYTLSGEVITNGNMESNSDWSDHGSPSTGGTQSTEQYRSSGNSWKVVADGALQGIEQNVTWSNNSYYYGVVYIYPTGGMDKIKLQTDYSGLIEYSVTAGEWNKLEFLQYVSDTSGFLRIRSYEASTYYVDDVSIQKSIIHLYVEVEI